MRLYAQWLDGAYFNLASHKAGVGQENLLYSTASVLKLHALLGTRIVLSDIQLIDSPVVLHLFYDESFRDFLKTHPGFFELIAYPENIQRPTRYSITTGGLRRALVPGWISSAFPNPDATREFSQRLLDSDELDVEKQLRDRNSPFNIVRDKWPERAAFLEGMLRGLAHFSSYSDAPLGPPSHEGPPLTLYDMLLLTLQNRDLAPVHKRYLEMTVEFIQGAIENRSDWGRQSIIFAALDRKLNPFNPDYHTIKNTVNHAYNATVEYSLAPDGGSLGYLPRSAQVGLYLDRPTNSLLPLVFKEGRPSIPSFSKKIPLVLNWDPGTLHWRQVADVAKKTATSAAKLQTALRSGSESEVQSAIDEHARALSSCLVSKTPRHIPPWLWIAGPVVVLIGYPEAVAIIGGVKTVEEVWRDVLYRGRKYLVTNTIRKVAQMATPRSSNWSSGT